MGKLFKLLGKQHCVYMQKRLLLVQLVSIDFSIVRERSSLIQVLVKSLI